ncbi:serine/threonine-protein kinase [Nocardioides sp.]|uniref:serine/threonine-protein kinase n=1 Tax=Nocardioides sp. TaxID=35761 RepID=UPI002B268756|nr:serine/threonine-protein kinase [Nocardioides sp.]
MTTQPHQPQPQVGDYSLLAKIGEGGMGVVHLARRPGGDRVALKVLRPHIVGDDEARQRLAREVASLSRIRSRWVAEILDADPWAPVPYVATRYVPGLSLHDHVLQEGVIEGDDLLWFAACLAEGLSSIHGVGVLHRDIKPSNVLMEGRTPIVIDFGLARVADDPKLTHTGWLLGTPGYLAPEILYGEDATAASDVHSWAATVAFAATGRSPFGRGPSMAIMDRVRRGEHDLTGLEGPLLDVVEAALDPEAGRRPTLEAILAWLRPQTTQPSPVLAAAPTVAERVGPAGTRLLTTVLPDSPRAYPPPTSTPPPPPPHPYPHAGFAEESEEPETPRVPLGERLRRSVVVLAGAVLVGAVCAAVPWVALAVLVVAVWLLRSGSIAASRVEQRRQVRGRRWYDAPQLLVNAPWHLVQSIPSTIMLLLWSAGLAAAVGLVCYAVTAPLGWSLFGSGVVLALSLWWGPGGSRVRSPLRRLVNPASRSAGTWLITVAVLLGISAAVGGWVLTNDVTWTPAAGVPFVP